MAPNLSVIVCTRNRAGLLKAALESLSRQTLEKGRYEVLVVDNGSADDTREVVEGWAGAGRFSCRYAHETALGLNHARNHGIAEAAGEIIAFLDDDARAEPRWLEALVGAFDSAQADGVGGKILPIWERPPPRWLHQRHLPLLVVFDLGNEPSRVDRYPYLFGTNMAFRAATLRRFGNFHPDLDRKGRNLLSAGDTEICHRVVQGGGILLYEPRAVVHHLVPAERLRLLFLLRRSYDQGRSVCRFQEITGARLRNPSRAVSVLKTLATLPQHVLRLDAAEMVNVLTQTASHLGYLREAKWMGRPADA